MFIYVYKIYKEGGLMFQIILGFILISPIYFINPILVPAIILIILFSQNLNHVAPSERVAIMYKFFGFNRQIMNISNYIHIILFNTLNIIFICLVFILRDIYFDLESLLIQIGILNGLVFFTLCYSDVIFILKLKYWYYVSYFKPILITIYLLSVLFLFFMFWALFLQFPYLAWVSVFFFICIWFVILFSNLIWKE
jgi:hypothetical protein